MYLRHLVIQLSLGCKILSDGPACSINIDPGFPPSAVDLFETVQIYEQLLIFLVRRDFFSGLSLLWCNVCSSQHGFVVCNDFIPKPTTTRWRRFSCVLHAFLIRRDVIVVPPHLSSLRNYDGRLTKLVAYRRRRMCVCPSFEKFFNDDCAANGKRQLVVLVFVTIPRAKSVSTTETGNRFEKCAPVAVPGRVYSATRETFTIRARQS